MKQAENEGSSNSAAIDGPSLAQFKGKEVGFLRNRGYGLDMLAVRPGVPLDLLLYQASFLNRLVGALGNVLIEARNGADIESHEVSDCHYAMTFLAETADAITQSATLARWSQP